MNVMELITPEAAIGGLSISDNHIRAAAWNPKARKRQRDGFMLAEETLPEGVIVEGVVRDAAALIAALKRLLMKMKGVSYFIVSIPPHATYTRILSFPRAVSKERLEEAVQLSLGFQIPLQRADAYVDYHTLPSSDTNRVFVAAAPKSVIDGYQKALQGAGVRAVAIEPHTVSVARSYEGAPVRTLLPYEKSVVVAILEHGSVGFSRSLPLEKYHSEDVQEKEIVRIEDFYTMEYGTKPQILFWKDAPLPEALASLLPKDAPPAAWSITFGALARALLPRSSDTLVSLLPLGTEEAYAFQKAIAFSILLRDVTIGLVLFFVASYAGTFVVTSIVSEQAAETLSKRAVSPASAEIVAQEARAQSFNALLETTAVLASESPRWSMFLESLRGNATDGIILTNISIDTPDRPIQITGIASTRAALNNFKDTLVARGDLTHLVLPLTNLELRADIPFSMTFSLLDPTMLYPH